MKRLMKLRPDFDFPIEILSNTYEDVNLLARAWTSKVMQIAEDIKRDEGEKAVAAEGTWETDSSDVSESEDSESDAATDVKAEPDSLRVKAEPQSPHVKTEPQSPPSRAEYRSSARSRSPTQVKRE